MLVILQQIYVNTDNQQLYTQDAYYATVEVAALARDLLRLLAWVAGSITGLCLALAFSRAVRW